MKVAQKVENKIKKVQPGILFNYKDFTLKPSEFSAATKAVERLIKKGVIARASTGLFYKPKTTVFGNIPPKEEELLKPYLFDSNNKRMGYITGTLLFNKLKLTTQIPKTIQIATKGNRILTKLGNLEISSVKSYDDVENKNIYLLEILEVLRYFKSIPDIDTVEVISILKIKIATLSQKETETLVKTALKYPPRVMAFLGAILSELNKNEYLPILKDKINPLSSFNFGISKSQLSTIEYWNIK
jgi:hypothetical protein